MHVSRRVLAALLVLVATSTGIAAVTVATAAPSDCEEPGPVTPPTVTGAVAYDSEDFATDRITLTYDVTDAPTDFVVELPGVEAVVATDGFTVSRTGVTHRYRFRLTGDRETARITYEAISASADDWENGVFAAPSYENGTATLSAAGPGLVEERVMYLGGDYTVESVSNGCETIRVVRPCGVVIEEQRSDVADSLRAASGDLDIDHRWNETTVVAVEDVRFFGVVGAYFGEGDMIVEADMELDEPGNTWVHEYVHARQGYTAPAENASWLVEGSAEYYAARLTYEQGRIDRDEYADAVGQAATQPAVLADNSTWTMLTPYEQGAIVLTGLDRRLRAADGNQTLQTLLAAVNAEAQDGDGPVTHAEVKALVRQQGNASTAQWFDTHVTEATIPAVRPTAAGAGLAERDRSLGAVWQASLAETMDEIQARIGNILSPPGRCSRGGLFI